MDPGKDAERSRTISMTKLVSLTMATSDPDEAAAIGSVAIARAAVLKPKRAAEDVGELQRFARRTGTEIPTVSTS